jgi:hypothetical protein
MTITSDLLDASDLNASQITHTKNKSGHAMPLHLIAVSLIFHTRIASIRSHSCKIATQIQIIDDKYLDRAPDLSPCQEATLVPELYHDL